MKLKQYVSPGKKAVLCTQAVLILMAAGLTVLQAVTGYRPLLLLGLMLWLSVGISVTMIALSAFGVISALAGSILHNFGAFAVLLNSSRILREE